MKKLIICEGTNEKTVVDMLLENDRLCYGRDELLGMIVYHARQIDTNPTLQNMMNQYKGELDILRVGDSLNDKLRIPKKYKNQIRQVLKYCTKPELEMLLIISEGRIKDYEKFKSKKSPKSYCKENVRHNGHKYDNTSDFYREYYGDRIELLTDSINEYKRIKGKHKIDELYLADLLRKER